MQQSQDRLTALEQQVAAQEERLRALEARLSSAPLAASCSTGTLPFDLETLHPPHSDLPAQEGSRQGMLSYSGFAQFDQQRYQLARQQTLPALFDMSPEPLAQVFAALANPHRILILRALCDGPRSSQSLQEVLGMSSTGQLYHHLKELLAAGLIIQHGRSGYSIDPVKLIPICVALTVASHLMTGSQAGQADLLLQQGEEGDQGSS
jgi:ArsR family transcriptional regulator